MLHWWRIFGFELFVIFLIIAMLGYIKVPKFLRRKVIQRGSPWGYYRDAVPKSDPGFFAENNKDFEHNTGTAFSAPEGFGDYGEFSGFGEMGEYGAHFAEGGSD